MNLPCASQPATAKKLRFTPGIYIESKALSQSTYSPESSDNPTEGFAGTNSSGVRDSQAPACLKTWLPSAQTLCQGRRLLPQHRTITQGPHAQRWDGKFARRLPHPILHTAGDLHFALFVLPRHRTNAFPSNLILIPNSCSERNLHI